MKRFNSFIVTALAIFAVVAFIGCKNTAGGTPQDQGPGILSVWEYKDTKNKTAITATIYDNKTATVTVVVEQEVSGQGNVKTTMALNGTITGADISKAFTFTATSGKMTAGPNTAEMPKEQLDQYKNISAKISDNKMTVTGIMGGAVVLTKK